MSRSRAERRHHMDRIKKRVRGYYQFAREPVNPREVCGKLARTRTPCSCPMCGNPRKHFGSLTRQEKLAGKEKGAGGMSPDSL